MARFAEFLAERHKHALTLSWPQILALAIQRLQRCAVPQMPRQDECRAAVADRTAPVRVVATMSLIVDRGVSAVGTLRDF